MRCPAERLSLTPTRTRCAEGRLRQVVRLSFQPLVGATHAVSREEELRVAVTHRVAAVGVTSAGRSIRSKASRPCLVPVFTCTLAARPKARRGRDRCTKVSSTASTVTDPVSSVGHELVGRCGARSRDAEAGHGKGADEREGEQARKWACRTKDTGHGGIPRGASDCSSIEKLGEVSALGKPDMRVI